MPKKISLDNLQLGYTDGRKVSEEEKKQFVAKLQEMSKKYKGTTPEDFITLFVKENGLKDGVLLLDQDSKAKTNSQGGHAKGLIQFVPSTAKGLGLDQSKLSSMSPVEQLEYVDKFYDTYKQDIDGYESLYLTTFYPAALSQPDDFVIASGDATAYTSNKAIDKNKDGKITKQDFLTYALDTVPTKALDLFEEVSQEEYDNSYANLDKDIEVINNAPKDGVPAKEGDVVEIDGKKFQPIRMPNGDVVNVGLYGTDPRIKRIGNDLYFTNKKYGDERRDRDYIKIPTEKNENYENGYYPTDGDGFFTSSFASNKMKDATTVYTEQVDKFAQIENPTSAQKADMKRLLSNASRAMGEDSQEFKKFGNDYFDKIFVPQFKQESEAVRAAQQKKIDDIEDQLDEETDSATYSKLSQQLKKEYENLNKINKVKDQYEKEIFQEVNKSESKMYFDATDNQFKYGDNKILGYGDEYDIKSSAYDLWNNMASELGYSDSAVTGDTTKPGKTDSDTRGGSGNAKDGSGDAVAGNGTDFNKGDYSPINNMPDTQDDSVQGNAKAQPYSEDYLNQQIKEIDDALAQQKASGLPTSQDKQPSWLDKVSPALSSLGDLGRGILGMGGALEQTPTYEESGIFKNYIEDANRRKDMGLSPEEMSLRKQLAERAFGFDVKNIRRLAGGSAGVALGNLGRAAGTLQDRYAQMGAEDSAMRRMNLQRFDQAAIRGESVHRQKFEDRLAESLRNKQAGAALVRDSMKNMQERADYEKAYGEGSLYQKYKQELIDTQKETRASIQQGREMREDKYRRELTRDKELMQQRLKELKGQ